VALFDATEGGIVSAVGALVLLPVGDQQLGDRSSCFCRANRSGLGWSETPCIPRAPSRTPRPPSASYRFLYVSDGASSDVEIYAVDPVTGALAAVGALCHRFGDGQAAEHRYAVRAHVHARGVAIFGSIQ
jgi:hypothetical protein